MDDQFDIQWLASASGAEAWRRCKDALHFSKALLSGLGLSPKQLQTMATQTGFANGAATQKVADPWSWLWTRTLLEQASDQWVAEETASDFPQNASVIDGCCGAGVDAIFIAKHLAKHESLGDRLRAIDVSETSCLLTRINSSLNGVPLEPKQMRFEDSQIHQSDWLHLDPDRRATGRTVNVYATDPGWPEISDRIMQSTGASIKVAPGFQPENDFPWGSCGPPDTRRWISRDGTVRQQRLYWRIPRWMGADRVVSAYRRGTGWKHEIFHQGPYRGSLAFDLIEKQIGSNLFVADHDPALRAAGCVVALSAKLGISVLGNEFGYCLASKPVSNPMLRWFKILDSLPLDRKKVRAMSRTTGVGRWELKSRNVDVDLIQWKKDLIVDSDSDLVRWLLITKLGQRHICLVCEELSS